MATEVIVPRLGWSMEEGTFQEWLKADGERVEAGDMLFVLEGDKASQEVESFDAGYLRLPPDVPQSGDAVVVGQRLAFLADEDDLEPWKDSPQSGAVPDRKTPLGQAPGPVTAQTKPVRSGKSISPRALRLATELDVDWDNIDGTGRGGRIREQDIRAAAALGQAEAPGTSLTGKTEPLSATRKAIARQMVIGTNPTAPVTLHREVDATALVALRRQFKQACDDNKTVPTYTDILIRLVAEALKSHPRLNSQWREEGIFVPEQIHIAFAVDTPTGLLAPVVSDADRLSIDQLADQTKALAQQARAGQLEAGQMRDGTFTVSNLGGLGVDSFTPVINPPQCAVLGVGRIRKKVVWHGEQAVGRDRLNLSLTFDHRIVDGAPAARFLDDLAGQIEQPPEWLTH